jgi:APA family basic amino acid/polyamine antiporter
MMVTSPVVVSALKTTDIARVLPHEGMILLVWTLGGFLTLAGALTYAELGALYPRAGGMYHYLKEAYGTFWGFLYGWACFLVLIAAGVPAYMWWRRHPTPDSEVKS